MEKESKKIIIIQIAAIIIFMLAGMAVGCILAKTDSKRLADAKYTELLAYHDFPVPEPISCKQAMISLGFIFSGIAAGAVIYRHFADRWFTALAPKIILGFFLLPLFIAVGTFCWLPLIIYKLFVLLRLRKSLFNENRKQ